MPKVYEPSSIRSVATISLKRTFSPLPISRSGRLSATSAPPISNPSALIDTSSTVSVLSFRLSGKVSTPSATESPALSTAISFSSSEDPAIASESVSIAALNSPSGEILNSIWLVCSLSGSVISMVPWPVSIKPSPLYTIVTLASLTCTSSPDSSKSGSGTVASAPPIVTPSRVIDRSSTVLSMPPHSSGSVILTLLAIKPSFVRPAPSTSNSISPTTKENASTVPPSTRPGSINRLALSVSSKPSAFISSSVVAPLVRPSIRSTSLTSNSFMSKRENSVSRYSTSSAGVMVAASSVSVPSKSPVNSDTPS